MVAIIRETDRDPVAAVARRHGINERTIQNGRELPRDCAEVRLISDEIVPATTDRVIERVVTQFTDSGMVGAASNRRAFRVAQEPLDRFPEYFAANERDQEYCRFRPALIAPLERR